MSNNTVSIDNMADAIIEGLEEYRDLTGLEVKKAARKAAAQVKKDIASSAPSKTGKYKSSWSTKAEKETSTSVNYIIYSKNRYQLAHLLEKGHAKRGGGRVAARVHIAPAEQAGIETFEKLIQKALKQ